MSTAQAGDTVTVHYKGKLSDGTVFDTSEDRDPLTLTLGAGQVIPGFESAVVGMDVGQTKTQTMPADSAYGPARQDLLFDVERASIPETIDLKRGLRLEVHQENGERLPVTVAGVSDDTVTLDANHPLAGKDLTFEITLLDITDPQD